MTTAELRDEIADVLEREIRGLLPRGLGDYKLTLLARVVDDLEADILVTQDEEDEIADAVERGFRRSPVPEG